MALDIDLLRHGEPVGGRRYRGDGVDDPLSEAGWAQMWFALGSSGGWRTVLSSPMRRAREFAEAFAQRHGLDCRVDARLREIGMGAWEGLTAEDVRASDPAAYAANYEDPVAGRPANAEPLASLQRRVAGVLDAIEGEGPVLVVAHAGVIRAAIAYAVQGSATAMMRIPVPYAGLTRLRRDARGWALIRHEGL